MKKVLLLVNPTSRNGREAVVRAEAFLKDRGWKAVNQGFDPKRHDGCQLIRDCQADVDAVVVGGGDGSVNAVLPALIEKGIPLLLLPLGTANNLARTMGVPSDLDQAFALLETGRVEKIDVGVANGIPFVNVVGLGLSTAVNRLVHHNHKRWLGVFAFIFTAFRVASRMTPFKVNIVTDGKVHRAKTWQVSVCNGRNYGSGLVIHEEASLKDERLHGLSTEVRRWWEAFFLGPSLIAGRFRREQNVTCFDGKHVRIETKKSMSVDIDGDIKTRTPLEVHVQPKAISIFVPPLVPKTESVIQTILGTSPH